MNYSIVIPSYNRADRIVKHPLLSVATVVVPKSQEALYQKTIGSRCGSLVAHNDLKGVSPTRNFILERAYPKTDDFVFMCDDDLDEVRFLMSFRVIKIKDVAGLRCIIERAAQLAKDAGTNVFGFARTPRPQERTAMRPFSFRSVVEANAMGIIGHDDQRFDENCIVAEDIDFSLETLRRHRILMQDLRYAWCFDRWSAGGLSSIRTTERVEASHRHLAQKWGRGVVIEAKERRATGQSVSVRVN